MLSAIFEIVHKYFLEYFFLKINVERKQNPIVKQKAKIIVPKNIKSLKILPSDTKESNPLSKILKKLLTIQI